MTCILQEVTEANRDAGEPAFEAKDYQKLQLVIGMEEATLEKLQSMVDEYSTHTSTNSGFKAKIANWALQKADKTATWSAAALPQTVSEALARKMFLGPIFTSGLLQHGIHMKSWTGRALWLMMTRLPGGTAGAFAEGAELNAAALTHKIRNELTWDWQDGFKDKMMDLIKSRGPTHWHEYTAIHDPTKLAQSIWKEIIQNTNKMKLGQKVEWSSPELEAVAKHVHATYEKMYVAREEAGGIVDTSRSAPIRFNKNLSDVLDQMGYDGVMEAIRRGGNQNPEGVYSTLAYSPRKKGMTILGDSIQGEIDLSYESNGVSLMDAVDLNGWAGVARDIAKVSGETAIKKTSKGIIGSEAEWQAALEVVGEELLHNGTSAKEATKQLQLLQDTWDSISGNPIRGGVAPEVQMLRSAAVNTLLGTAGFAQLGVVSLGMASKLAAVAMNRGGLELRHLLHNTGRGTILAAELESLIKMNAGIHNLMPVVVTEELAGALKYSWLRQAGQFVLKKATFAEYQGSISRALMTANGMTIVSKYAAKFITTQTLNDVARYYHGVSTSMEHKRGVTGGFWEPNGPNPLLKQLFERVSYTPEGNVQSLNLHLMSAQEQAYLSGLLTAELTRITGDARVAGEFPSWMNNLVAHSLIQFKDIGIKLASSNAMAGIRYQDTDAVFEHLVAAGISSMLVYTRDSLGDLLNPPKGQGKPAEYADVVKHLFRMNEIMGPVSDGHHVWSIIENAPQNPHLADTLWEEAPILGVAYHMYEAAMGATKEERLTNFAKSLPFSNVAMVNRIVQEHWKPAMLNDLTDFKNNDYDSTHWTTGRK